MSSGEKTKKAFQGCAVVLMTFVMAMCLSISGCAKKRPQPIARPSLEAPVSYEVAMRMAAFDLFAQISNQQIPPPKKFIEEIGSRQNKDKVKTYSFSCDAIMNADTGEEIELSNQFREIIALTATNSFPQYAVVDMNSQSIDRADFVIIGIIKQEKYNDQTTKLPRLYISAVDMKTSQVKAHSEVWFSNQSMKLQPTPLFSDSPMFLKDDRSEKTIAAARTQSGDSVDRDYFSAMGTNALLAEASKAYDSGNHQLSADLFSKAAEREDGQVMKTYAGLYQAYLKLKKMTEAEEAFAKLAEVGIKNGTLSVKFLFKVNDTNFFGEPDELVEYEIWLRQIGRKIIESQACVEISGHASRSGKADYNKKLSDKRSHKIQKQLLGVSSSIADKTVAVGRGFEENIVGSGTDDMRDAIDRRVEFRVIECDTVR